MSSFIKFELWASSAFLRNHNPKICQCLFQNDRYNWATRTRFILTNCPPPARPLFPDPSCLANESPWLAKPFDSSLLFSETWALKYIVPLGQGCQKGKNPLDCRSEALSDCFLWLERASVCMNCRSIPALPDPHLWHTRVSNPTSLLRLNRQSLWF